jgi:hypothetical protein
MPPRNVRFGELLVTVDDRRTIIVGVLERLHRASEPETLFEIDQCLRAGAELDRAVTDFMARNSGADCWDLILALRDLGAAIGNASFSGASHFHYWRGRLQLFASQLQRRLLDFI